MIPSSVNEIGDYIFYNCPNLAFVTIPNSVKSISSSAFQGCKNILSVTCYTESLPKTDKDLFKDSNIENATLLVPESALQTYSALLPWCDFGTIKAIEPNTGDFKEIEIVDGVLFTVASGKEYDQISYTRNFTNPNWQALYIPFSMSYEDWAEDFEVAKVANFHEYDDDDNGEIDRTLMEVIKVKSGNLIPNTPYLIKAKSTGNKTIKVHNKTLFPAMENSIDCSSTITKFVFIGTYKEVSGAEIYNNGYYAMSGGALKHLASASSSGLKPYRWYLKTESRMGGYNNSRERSIEIVDEDGVTSILDVNDDTEIIHRPIYSLDGRIVRNDGNKSVLHKGMYILNGKKFYIK